jgi:catabolite regulation protein CreA
MRQEDEILMEGLVPFVPIKRDQSTLSLPCENTGEGRCLQARRKAMAELVYTSTLSLTFQALEPCRINLSGSSHPVVGILLYKSKQIKI